MSKNFVTLRQLNNKIGTSFTGEQDKYFTASNVKSGLGGMLDTSYLSKYNDNDFVIDDDIVKKETSSGTYYTVKVNFDSHVSLVTITDSLNLGGGGELDPIDPPIKSNVLSYNNSISPYAVGDLSDNTTTLTSSGSVSIKSGRKVVITITTKEDGYTYSMKDSEDTVWKTTSYTISSIDRDYNITIVSTIEYTYKIVKTYGPKETVKNDISYYEYIDYKCGKYWKDTLQEYVKFSIISSTLLHYNNPSASGTDYVSSGEQKVNVAFTDSTNYTIRISPVTWLFTTIKPGSTHVMSYDYYDCAGYQTISRNGTSTNPLALTFDFSYKFPLNDAGIS